MFLVTAKLMSMNFRGCDGVTTGSPFMILAAEQVVITLFCGVAADSNLYSTTSVFYDRVFYLERNTSNIRKSFRTGEVSIFTKIFAVLV